MPGSADELSAFSKVVKLSLPAHAFIVFLETRYFRLAPRQLIIPVFISSTIFILVCSSTLSNGLRLTTAATFFFLPGIAFLFLSLVTSYIRTRHTFRRNQVVNISGISTTVAAVVFEHHGKNDGTYNVKIRVYHKFEKKYLDTSHFVSKRQLDAKFNIKDKFLIKTLEQTLDEYREAISQLGFKLEFFTCEQLREYLRDLNSDIDFVAFCTRHMAQLKRENRSGTAGTHRTVRNSLVDYFRRESVSITEIHSNMLMSYERYLKSERTIKRVNQLGKMVETKEKGLSESGLHNHMRDLRTLFNAACSYYNNEDLGLYKIKHYPFKKYKIGSAPLTKKRNICIDQLKTIRDCETPKDSRAELAKDLFMLSFYLCGMNAVDIYDLQKKNIKNGRIEYNRAKTKGRRKDNAFISVKLIDEAKPLIKNYIETFPNRYSNYNGLNTALSEGMKDLRRITGIDDITFYWARHTFANIARNGCRMSKDDVALALNHVDEGHRTTDICISKDWHIVDEVQEKVVKLILC
jgi:integrase